MRRISTTQIVLRLLVVAAAFVAIGSTRAAAESPVLFLEFVIVGLALWSAWAPDSHVALAVAVLVGLHWLIAVDDPATPWTIGAGAGVALLHVATAAASIGPPAAEWTAAIGRRWGLRLGIAASASVRAWIVVALADRADVGRSSVLVTAALVAVAAALLWTAGYPRRRET